MRYFLEISYNGTAYNGWQKQKNAPSVQETVERALSAFLREETSVTGAGRTDTGVHASYFVLHFDSAHDIISKFPDFIYHINAILPRDIAARRVQVVPETAHARFDATSREYKYHIINHKDPFRTGTAWQLNVALDVGAMNRAASCLVTKGEFTAFSKLHSDNKTDTCDVTQALWMEDAGGLVFTIRADRFLRNMVRSIVGNLVNVGTGKITPEQFAGIFASGDRSLATGASPARGLFLTDITYPDKLFRKTDKI